MSININIGQDLDEGLKIDLEKESEENVTFAGVSASNAQGNGSGVNKNKDEADDDIQKTVEATSNKTEEGSTSHNVEDNTHTVHYEANANGEGVCDLMRRAAADASKFNDYISYATILEELLDDPLHFDEEERIQILTTLRDILAADDKLVYEMGWDVPLLVLKYLVDSYAFDGNGVTGSRTTRLIMNIFSILCNKGNPKELFLKGCEAFSTWDVAAIDPSIEKYKHDIYVEGRYKIVRFSLCFELMFYSLRRIKSEYPSRFLATAITVLLSFVASNEEYLTYLSIGIVARRLYVFCRDYATPGEDLNDGPCPEVSDLEIAKQCKLIQTCLAWSPHLLLQRVTASWAQRLFYEFKVGVALEPDVTKRVRAYELSINTQRLTECLERMAQLAFSLDLDPVDDLHKLLQSGDDGEEQEEEAEESGGAESFQTLSQIPKEGILLLATQIAFDDRRTGPLTLEEIYNLVQKFLVQDGGSTQASAGIRDAVVFWIMWSTRDIVEDQMQLNKDKFSTLLQQLMLMCAETQDKDSRFIVYSICAKLLRLQKPEISFEVLLDILEFCPYTNLREAGVRMLKCLGSAAPKKVANVDQLETKLKGLSVTSPSPSPTTTTTNSAGASTSTCEGREPGSEPRISLDIAKLQKLEPLITRAFSDIEASESGLRSDEFTLVIAWLNFMTVVKMETGFTKSIVKQSRALAEKEAGSQKEKNKDPRLGILNLAVDSLEKAQLL